MAGDYILAIVSQLIADIKHDDVTLVLSQVRSEMVHGSNRVPCGTPHFVKKSIIPNFLSHHKTHLLLNRSK